MPALDSARRDPPVIHRGDLRTDLPALATQAPPGATLVIYHSAVLAYLTPADRRRFADTVRALPWRREQIMARLAHRYWPPDAALLPWVTSAYPR